MNNPFSRLKHYIPDESDPQENHATECLAACLVFSPQIVRMFLKFLFADETTLFKIDEVSEVEIDTQVFLPGSGYLDLLLRKDDVFTIAIEVKVNSPEYCDHHRDQLKNYQSWLNKNGRGNLFTLVRIPDERFRPGDYGAKRKTWRGLKNVFKDNLKKDFITPAEASLMSNFCKYLESEGIVSDYDTKDLPNFGSGLKAQEATTGILNQVDSWLRPDGFSCKLIDHRRDWWPQLKIEHPDWDNIFGKGNNQKMTLFFMVPGVWEANRHDFLFTIELWHEDHKNDWADIKPKLAQWFEMLKSDGLSWTVFQTWKMDKDNVPAAQIQSPPKRICFWRDGEILLNEKSPQSEQELVNLLVSQAKQYAKIVSSLKP